MTGAEACGVQVLLDWVLALQVWEHPDGSDVADDETLRKTVRHLADRSHKALGAGVSLGPELTEQLDRLLTRPVHGVPT